ncbi:hypothetical protein BDW22DRAFT_1345191 [Trametopsis cervina]|nr:hypothetical protein BDW22DRAFT_1345191 [Trametopsis cervina]
MMPARRAWVSDAAAVHSIRFQEADMASDTVSPRAVHLIVEACAAAIDEADGHTQTRTRTPSRLSARDDPFATIRVRLTRSHLPQRLTITLAREAGTLTASRRTSTLYTATQYRGIVASRPNWAARAGVASDGRAVGSSQWSRCAIEPLCVHIRGIGRQADETIKRILVMRHTSVLMSARELLFVFSTRRASHEPYPDRARHHLQVNSPPQKPVRASDVRIMDIATQYRGSMDRAATTLQADVTLKSLRWKHINPTLQFNVHTFCNYCSATHEHKRTAPEPVPPPSAVHFAAHQPLFVNRAEPLVSPPPSSAVRLPAQSDPRNLTPIALTQNPVDASYDTPPYATTTQSALDQARRSHIAYELEGLAVRLCGGMPLEDQFALDLDMDRGTWSPDTTMPTIESAHHEIAPNVERDNDSTRPPPSGRASRRGGAAPLGPGDPATKHRTFPRSTMAAEREGGVKADGRKTPGLPAILIVRLTPSLQLRTPGRRMTREEITEAYVVEIRSASPNTLLCARRVRRQGIRARTSRLPSEWGVVLVRACWGGEAGLSRGSCVPAVVVVIDSRTAVQERSVYDGVTWKVQTCGGGLGSKHDVEQEK